MARGAQGSGRRWSPDAVEGPSSAPSNGGKTWRWRMAAPEPVAHARYPLPGARGGPPTYIGGERRAGGHGDGGSADE